MIPSWEFGDEENKEVSATLRRIRQKYDNIHKTVLANEKELEVKKVSLFRRQLKPVPDDRFECLEGAGAGKDRGERD